MNTIAELFLTLMVKVIGSIHRRTEALTFALVDIRARISRRRELSELNKNEDS